MALICLLVAAFLWLSAQNNLAPHLEKNKNETQLIVHDKPLLIRGGELGNSSASVNAYMLPVWSKLKNMQLNTVLMPVYWELIEPEENKYEFGLIDSLIANIN